MNIVQLNIGKHEFNALRLKKVWNANERHKPSEAFAGASRNYLAEAIRWGGKFFYRIDGTTVEALDYEYQRVIANPSLYYFSSALKLHFRVLKAKELGLGSNWPIKPAAPINIFEQGR